MGVKPPLPPVVRDGRPGAVDLWQVEARWRWQDEDEAYRRAQQVLGWVVAGLLVLLAW